MVELLTFPCLVEEKRKKGSKATLPVIFLFTQSNTPDNNSFLKVILLKSTKLNET